MRIKTIIGEVNVERCRKYRHVGTVTVKVIMMKDGDRENSFTLERHLYQGIRTRRDVTARIMWETVAEILKDRDDLDGMTIRGVTVVEENQIWATSYDDMYPKDEESGS